MTQASAHACERRHRQPGIRYTRAVPCGTLYPNGPASTPVPTGYSTMQREALVPITLISMPGLTT